MANETSNPVESERRWNLDDILKREEFDALHQETEQKLGEIPNFFAAMNPEMDARQLKAFFDFDEVVSTSLARLGHYSSLLQSVDTKSGEARLLTKLAKELALKYAEATRPVMHWLKGKEVPDKQKLDDENAKRLFAAVPEVKYMLERAREGAKYTLSQPEESVITEKNATSKSAILDLYSLITNEFKFNFKPEDAEEAKTIETRAELMQYARSPKPQERKAAYQELLRVYGENKDKLFIIYQALAGDWAKGAKRRGYASAISVRNYDNDISDEAVSALLQACSINTEVFQRHFRFKAKEFGLEKLRRYDLAAPLQKEEEEKIPFDQAVQLVLETLQDFHDGFYAKARLILDRQHVDSHPRPNKRSGGFCAPITPGIAPYVLLNYTGNIRDVFTLAHELGHCIHELYSSVQSINCCEAPLTLAETASNFSEIMLFERMLREAKDDQVKKAMLADRVSDSYAGLIRQSYFVKFEILAHEAVEKGVTADQLSDIYFETLKEQFGDSIELPAEFRHEWMYIPHLFRTPFYCYAYSFGESLSMSLYSRYKQEGKSFIPAVEKILSAGASVNPQKLLQELGIDLSSPGFWNSGFDIVRNWQDELEKL